MSINVILPSATNFCEIRHLPELEQGWYAAESRHFRIFHRASAEVAERALNIAERTKSTAQDRWFAGRTPHWPRRLAIRLFPDADTYRRETGAPMLRPGHAIVRTEDARMVLGEIDMYIDGGDFLSSVLPHEVTHAVVGGNFSRTPRWADEGMAMLSESEKHVRQYLRDVAQFKKQNRLPPLTEVLQRKEYPSDPDDAYAYYCQSVCLVGWLCSLQSPETFIQFVRDSFRQGYAAALVQNYSIHDFQELEERWRLSLSGKKGKKRAP